MHVESESRERAGGWGCGTWSMLVGGLVIGALITSLLINFASVQSRVDANLTRIREAGEPITTQELESYYAVPPPDDDCTQLWLGAMAPFDTPAFESAAKEMLILGRPGEIPLPGEPWPDLDVTKKFLEQYQSSLDLMHEAAERGGAARYDIDFELGLELELIHDQKLRTAARLLTLEANVRAHQGDARGTAESIQTMFMVARSLENEPLIISQLVRIALSGMAKRELLRLLPIVEFSDEDLRQLQTDLRAADYGEGLRRAMIGERVMVMWAHETMNAQLNGLWEIARGPDRRLTLDFFEQIIIAAEQPWPQAMTAAKAAEVEINNVSGGSGWKSSLYIMTTLLTPSVQVLFPATARAIAKRDAVDAAIAIELFRRRNGSLPEKLEQLVPEFLPQVPIDPFDGQPLRYLVEPDRYVVYSVGDDGKDDGGFQEEDSPGPDFVFEVRLGGDEGDE